MWVGASTDYAIRMMICLADAAGPVSSSKLARMIGVSTRYLLQIGARLRDAGMITVTYGSSMAHREDTSCLYLRKKFVYWTLLC